MSICDVQGGPLDGTTREYGAARFLDVPDPRERAMFTDVDGMPFSIYGSHVYELCGWVRHGLGDVIYRWVWKHYTPPLGDPMHTWDEVRARLEGRERG